VAIKATGVRATSDKIAEAVAKNRPGQAKKTTPTTPITVANKAFR
jgi:hypothetical protein